MTALAETTPAGSVVDPLATTGTGQYFAAHHIALLAAIGLLILFVSWAPLLLKRLPLSLPMLCVAIGWALFEWTPLAVFSLHPLRTPEIAEMATELIVIVSLMGAGLKIARPLTWANWRITVRLLAIAMPLTILFVLLAGQWLLGLGLATALLLGAVLAPTDPVLASDIQVEAPHSDYDDEVRFSLTKEAGLNDALAFPFVHLAILASTAGFATSVWQEWALDYVLIRLSVGFVAGIALGWLVGWIIYRFPGRARLSRGGDGFVALGATLLIYAVTELAHGYGFLSVFVAGLMIRRAAQNHDFNEELHNFAEATERLLMLALLVLFGAMLASDEMFDDIGIAEVAFVAAALLIVRPLAAGLSLIGIKRPRLEKQIIAFYGIRGLGSAYYLAYALNNGSFAEGQLLWNILGMVVLASIILHGITVTPVMERLDRMHGQLEKTPPRDPETA